MTSGWTAEPGLASTSTAIRTDPDCPGVNCKIIELEADGLVSSHLIDLPDRPAQRPEPARAEDLSPLEPLRDRVVRPAGPPIVSREGCRS